MPKTGKVNDNLFKNTYFFTIDLVLVSLSSACNGKDQSLKGKPSSTSKKLFTDMKTGMCKEKIEQCHHFHENFGTKNNPENIQMITLPG